MRRFPSIEALRKKAAKLGIKLTRGSFGIYVQDGVWTPEFGYGCCPLGVALVGLPFEGTDEVDAAVNDAAKYFGYTPAYWSHFFDGVDNPIPTIGDGSKKRAFLRGQRYAEALIPPTTGTS